MKYLLSFVFLLILLAIIGSFISFRSEQNEQKYLTSEAPAQIIEMSPRKTIDPETGQTNRIQNVLITYRYSIKDEVFEKQKTVGKSESLAFKVNEPAKICFDLNDLEHFDLFPADYKCGE